VDSDVFFRTLKHVNAISVFVLHNAYVTICYAMTRELDEALLAQIRADIRLA